MKQMNQIIIEGNVVRDPVSKVTTGGTAFCQWTIAVDRYYKDKDGNFTQEVGFYDIEVWGEKFTSIVIENATKGRGVRVVGRLKQDRWKTEDGQSRSKITIVAEHIDFRPFFSKEKSSTETQKETAAPIENKIDAAEVVF